jgi:V8-like Glu-specific endopeptidase
VIELRDLFVLAYRRPAAAEQLADQAGLAPGAFPLFDDMRLIWTELLRRMADQGRLRRLVELASDDPTVAAYQSRFADMLSANPPLKAPEPPLPPGAWQGDDRHPTQAAALFHERLLEKRSRLLHVGVARRMGELARSVAKLEMSFSSGERTHGTGFLIQPDLLLSNHHNFVAAELGELVSVDADFDDERDFNGQRLVVKGLVETVKGNEAHDWAVIQLATTVDRPPIPLGSPFDVNVNDALIIIQHPLGAAKQFALDGMAVRFVDDNVVQYVADTQKGSSGSPVFSAAMHVVALHHAETEAQVTVNGAKETVFRNQGIRMKQVMQGLTDNAIPFVAQTS